MKIPCQVLIALIMIGTWVFSQPLIIRLAEAQLSEKFYEKTCPKLSSIVENHVRSTIKYERRIAASLLRLHFHDCFVQGCDSSLLLDGAGTEKLAPPNLNFVRGFEVIDSLKAAVEKDCPNVVSCADILALAALKSVILTGGPSWVLPLGRRDSLAPNFNLTSNLPGPNSNFSTLVTQFAIHNLTVTDMVALSGGHTIGDARCASIFNRIYNFSGSGAPDPLIEKSLLTTLQSRCPRGGDENVTNSMDVQTPTTFDNYYFKNIQAGEGLFHSDQILYTAISETEELVREYAKEQHKFFTDFGKSMVKMGNLNPLVGNAGQIRKYCRKANPIQSSGSAEVHYESETTTEDESSHGEAGKERYLWYLVEQMGPKR